jgi:competence protein ComEA
LFNLTRQEKSVLLFLGAVALCGISINYLSKNNPRFKGCLADMALKSASQSKINLNQATLEELTALSGIGPELARRIIDYRSASGGFKASEELKKVKGIGPRKFELLKDRVTLE